MKNFFLISLFLILTNAGLYFLIPIPEKNGLENINKIEFNNLENNTTLFEETSPTFDIVRITPKGDAVIAGRSKPNKLVNIFDGNEKLGQVSSDTNGEWVWSSKEPLKNGIKKLHLNFRKESGEVIRSDQTIIVFLEKDSTQIPIILKSSLSGKTNSHLMNLKALESGFTVDYVEYTPQGKINFSGRSEKNKNLSFFIDNKLIGKTLSNDKGFWTFVTKNKIPLGKLDLRVNLKLNNQLYSFNTPIFNENLNDLNQLLDNKNFVVQPGNSLWRIARKTMGGGIFYSEIYKKNQIKISDPDLIFPGQVFTIPLITEKINYEK